MGSNSQSIGTWRRLINFVLRMLSPPRSSSELPTEEGSPRNGKSSIRPVKRPNSFSGSELEVEFRHTDGAPRKEDDRSSKAKAQPREDNRPRPPRQLVNVASNIDEKSDAYIERMKKAMNRNYTIGHPHEKP